MVNSFSYTLHFVCIVVLLIFKKYSGSLLALQCTYIMSFVLKNACFTTFTLLFTQIIPQISMKLIKIISFRPYIIQVHRKYIPATQANIAHSTMVGVDPRFTVTSCESHSLSFSFWNHSAITTSILWDAKINKTEIGNRLNEPKSVNYFLVFLSNKNC